MLPLLQAFTPIVTMIALFFAGLEVPNKRLISSVVLIALGTAIASYGEINLSILGVIFMLLSESFEATRLVMTQILLVGLKFHPSKAPWQNHASLNAVRTVLLLPCNLDKPSVACSLLAHNSRIVFMYLVYTFVKLQSAHHLQDRCLYI